jgi:hypothetical protein
MCRAFSPEGRYKCNDRSKSKSKSKSKSNSNSKSQCGDLSAASAKARTPVEMTESWVAWEKADSSAALRNDSQNGNGKSNGKSKSRGQG